MTHDPAPLILSLRLDAASFGRLDALRRAHFPPAINHLHAHLTLFHHLPGELAQEVHAALAAAAACAPVALTFPGVRSLGRGVAAEVVAPGLLRVRGELAARFRGRLTPQDGQGFRPHVTLQNKVDAAAARALLAELAAAWAPWEGCGEALRLYRYRGGPWEAAGEWPFRG